MRKLLVLAAILASNAGFAQISNLSLNGAPARLTAYEGVEGSPYLFDDWARADIGTTNAGVKENVAYKLNIHDNQLEVINEAGNKIYLNKDFVEYALLERPSILIATGSPGMLTKLLFKKGYGEVKGVEDKDFVNVLAEGEKYDLVRRFYSDLVTPPKNSYAPTAGRMFVFEESYYLIDSKGNVSSVRNKTNKIIKSLQEEDQAFAKKIVKEGKLNLSREDHLVIFFQKLNEA